MSEGIDLFVCGRLCLFGEHSDWAGQNRRFNSEIGPGNALVCGTQEGIYARAERAERLIIETVVGEEALSFSCDMRQETLLLHAKDGGFFSYIAGVAAHLSMYYEIGGLRLTCHAMTLPLKKGLSSSAAICVLTARAFNQLYRLNLTTRGEMEVAYHGEQLTPSRCGRLDQACAYGTVPTHLRFDGDVLEVEPVRVGGPIHIVFADLRGEKDTIKILKDLNAAYPFPGDDNDRALYRLLGEDNEELVARAQAAMEAGDAQTLGALMTEAQRRFDLIAAPYSPKELKGEKLHAALDDPRIAALAYGGKGVGSQGDGCVQFVARNEPSQAALLGYLKERGMDAYAITLAPPAAVRRAVVPVAGFGTRMYPATKAVLKELLPVVDRDGLCKPALLTLLEELDEAGIEEIALIVRPGTQSIYHALFAPVSPANAQKLSPAMAQYDRRLRKIGEKIVYIEQTEQLGFGHAVYQSRAFTQGEPVLLCLGDHLYATNSESSCTHQVLSCYQERRKLTIAIAETPLHSVGLYGIAHGAWEDKSTRQVLNLTRLHEKPSEQLAVGKLGVMCQTREKYFSVFGQYVLTPEVYAQLERNIADQRTESGEYQLTSALDAALRREGGIGLRVNGERFDIGVPEKYRETVAGFGTKSV